MISHRNSIETWSKAGGEAYYPGSAYNFNLDSSQTYGNNVIRTDSSPLTYAIYNGDVNQNGSIDAIDISSVDNDAFNFVTGYVVTDVTGNNVTDATDLAITDNNTFNYVSKVTPP